MDSEIIMGKAVAATSGGVWVRSSRCTPGNNCVELRISRGAVGVRDAKKVGGSTLEFRGDRWFEFLRSIIR